MTSKHYDHTFQPRGIKIGFVLPGGEECQSHSPFAMDADQCIAFLKSQPDALRRCLGYEGLTISATRSHPHLISISTMKVVKEDSRHFTLMIPHDINIECADCSQLTRLSNSRIVRAGPWRKQCENCHHRQSCGGGGVCGGKSCTSREQALHIGLVCALCAGGHVKRWNAEYNAERVSDGSKQYRFGSKIRCLYSSINEEETHPANEPLTLPPLDGKDSFWLFNPSDRCKMIKPPPEPTRPGFRERSWCNDDYQQNDYHDLIGRKFT